MGVVYHVNYLNWFEIGRTEWVRQAGIAYKDMEAKGLLLPVMEIEASFRQPARYDEWITVCTSVAELSPVRVRFRSVIVSGDQTAAHGPSHEGDEPPGDVLVTGGTSHAWVNRDWKLTRFDREAPEWYRSMKALTGPSADGGS